MKLTPKRILSCSAFAATMAMAVSAAELVRSVGEPDALDRQALISQRAGSSAMLAVARADKRLVAVGERGIILLSDDNGITWKQARVPVSISLTNVRFFTSRIGWAVGHSGVVLRSDDGGESWQKQLDGGQAAQLLRNEVAADGAGARQEPQTTLADAERMAAEGPDKPFFDLHFFDENNGLVVGAFGLVMTTGDGGKHWQSARGRIVNPKAKHLYALHVAGKDIYIAGEQGALYRSSDGGMNFVGLPSPYAGSYFGLISDTAGTVVAFGMRGNAYRSSDKGATWQKSDTGTLNALTAGHLLPDGSMVLVDEAGGVLQSRDAGGSFKPTPVPQPSPLTGAVVAQNGALIVSSMRGVNRVVLNSSNAAEPKQ